VQDSFLNETAKLADVVLPASASTEDEGTFTNCERVVQRVRPVVPPKGESLPDWQIVQKMANSLGAGWDYQSPEEVWQELSAKVPAYAGLTYADLEASTAPRFAKRDADVKGAFTEVPAGVGQEQAGTQEGMRLLTGSVLQHFEAGTRSLRSEGLARLVGGAYVELSPADAKRLQLEEGSLAKVTSPVTGGTLTLPVAVSEKVLDGTVFIPGFDPAASVSRLVPREAGTAPYVQVEAA